MPLEIRELVVKVTIEDGASSSSKLMSSQEKKQLIEDCKKAVLKSIKTKKRR